MEHGEAEEEQMELPPGFRFHPTDEELITHYLSKKVLDATFGARAIGEVDLNKVEPWDLPWRAKMGVKEWYFFCMRDRKYPTGLRTNRATEAGYWKATGKDKEIYKGKALVGMKKTLVFYKGRAPKGEKCNWVMHEYRLEGKYSLYNLPKTPAKNHEWVISRVMNKSGGGMKAEMGGSSSSSSRLLPPLMDVNLAYDPANHVTCFSNVVEDQKGEDEQQQQQQSSLVAADYFSTSPMFQYSPNYTSDVPILPPSFLLSRMSLPAPTSSQYPIGNYMRQTYNSCSFGGGDGGGGGRLVQLQQSDGGYGTKQEKEMVSNVSQETGLTTDRNPEISSSDCLWHY